MHTENNLGIEFYENEDVQNAISRIKQGEAYVRGLREAEGSDEAFYFVFLFSENGEINRWTLYYLPLLAKRKGISMFLLVSPYSDNEEMADKMCRWSYKYVKCSFSDMQNVCRYYATYREYDPEYVNTGVIINGSPYPEDNRLLDIVGYKGISVKEYVAFAVMRFDRMPEDSETEAACQDCNYTAEKLLSNRDDYDIDRAVQDIKEGGAIYDRIRENHPEEMIYLLPYPGTGDIYLVGMYIADRMQLDGSERGVLVVSAKSCEKLYSLMRTKAAISEVIVLDGRAEAVKLLRFAKQIGYEKLKVLMINDAFDLIDIGKLRGYKSLDFNTLFQKTVFRTVSKKHGVRFRQNNADALYLEYGLRREKTVVLSPYTKSMASLPVSFWEKLADTLKIGGYDVITNVSGSEIPIKGTQGILIPYDMILDFLDKASAFIGMRSGLCDVISGSKTKKIIVYHPHIEPNTTSSIGFFGLGNMEIGREPLYELETNGEGDDIIRKIVEIIDG